MLFVSENLNHCLRIMYLPGVMLCSFIYKLKRSKTTNFSCNAKCFDGSSFRLVTRMHSSRMRTDRGSSILGGGGGV